MAPPVPHPARRRTSRMVLVRRAVAALVAGGSLIAGLGAGTAYAYWRSSGSGSGTAGAGTPGAVTVLAAAGTPSTKLTPGATADLVMTLSNPNGYVVTVVAVAPNGGAVPTGGVGPGTPCTSANTGVEVVAQSGLSLTLAGATTTTVLVPGGASMTTGSASGCQGAAFQIPVTVTVRR